MRHSTSNSQTYEVFQCLVSYAFNMCHLSALVSLPSVCRSSYAAVKPFCQRVRRLTQGKIYYHNVILGDTSVALEDRLRLYRFIFPKIDDINPNWFIEMLRTHLIMEGYDPCKVGDVVTGLIDQVFESCFNDVRLGMAPVENFIALIREIPGAIDAIWYIIYKAIRQREYIWDHDYLIRVMSVINPSKISGMSGYLSARIPELTGTLGHGKSFLNRYTFFYDDYPMLLTD